MKKEKLKCMKGLDFRSSTKMNNFKILILAAFLKIMPSFRLRTKKRLIFPGKLSAKKKKKKKILSKLDSPDKDITSTEPSAVPENDVPDDVEGERIIRKSTRTAVIVRQAERDAIRAALQATMKVRFITLTYSNSFHFSLYLFVRKE